MASVEKKLKWTSEKFKRRIGTTKPVFLLMLDILQTAYDKLHQSGGKPAAQPSVANETRLRYTQRRKGMKRVV